MVTGGAKDVLAKVLGEPVPLIDVLWARERDRHPLGTPEQRASLEARLMELARQIEHKGLSYQYIDVFRKRLRTMGRAVSAVPIPADLTWKERPSAFSPTNQQRRSRSERSAPRNTHQHPIGKQDYSEIGAGQRSEGSFAHPGGRQAPLASR